MCLANQEELICRRCLRWDTAMHGCAYLLILLALVRNSRLIVVKKITYKPRKEESMILYP